MMQGGSVIRMMEGILGKEVLTQVCSQCCQLLATIFGQINQKIRPLAKKFGPK
jgi:hypothetical protein